MVSDRSGNEIVEIVLTDENEMFVHKPESSFILGRVKRDFGKLPGYFDDYKGKLGWILPANSLTALKMSDCIEKAGGKVIISPDLRNKFYKDKLEKAKTTPFPNEDFINDPSRDNIGFANYINKHFNIGITPEHIKATFTLANFWAVSDDRVNLIKSITKEISDTAKQISEISKEMAVTSEKETIGNLDAELTRLSDILTNLDYEQKIIMKSMQPNLRQRVPWKKVG